MTKPAGLSLAAIKEKVVTEATEDLEPVLPDGSPSGIILKVKSDLSESVQRDLKALIMAQRRQDDVLEAKRRDARPGEVVPDLDDQNAYGRKLIAVRLAGWDGIDDPFTPESVDELLKLIPTFGPQILRKAERMAGFTRTSPKG